MNYHIILYHYRFLILCPTNFLDFWGSRLRSSGANPSLDSINLLNHRQSTWSTESRTMLFDPFCLIALVVGLTSCKDSVGGGRRSRTREMSRTSASRTRTWMVSRFRWYPATRRTASGSSSTTHSSKRRRTSHWTTPTYTGFATTRDSN